MIDIQVIKLSDFIHDVGEDEARSRLSSFSCGGLNDEVEHYLCDGAFRHSRKKTSITYLVMAAGDAKTCLAYYTLAVKPFSVKSSRLTARQKKEMETFRLGSTGGGRYHDEEAFAPCCESFYEGFGFDDVDFVSANDELADRESEDPADVCEGHLLKERLRVILSSLQDLERQVIDFRFGLSDGYSRTLEEVGRLFDMTREDICIASEICALRKLRHPSRMRSLGDYRNS